MEQDYLYKFVATQIPQDAELEPVCTVVDLTRDLACDAVTLSLRYRGRHFSL